MFLPPLSSFLVGEIRVLCSMILRKVEPWHMPSICHIVGVQKILVEGCPERARLGGLTVSSELHQFFPLAASHPGAVS